MKPENSEAPKKELVVVLSYAPLYSPPTNYTQRNAIPIDGCESLEHLVAKYESGITRIAMSCIWTKEDDGTRTANLLMEQGREIAKHLIAWAENKPEEWFNLSFKVADNEHLQYALALTPKIDKSIERWQLANYPSKQDADLARKDQRFEILFKPLTFATKNSKVSESLRATITDRINLAIIDVNEAPDNLELFSDETRDQNRNLQTGQDARINGRTGCDHGGRGWLPNSRTGRYGNPALTSGQGGTHSQAKECKKNVSMNAIIVWASLTGNGRAGLRNPWVRPRGSP